MRIGVLTTSYPRALPGRAGDPAGTFVAQMGRALARRGHEVEVLAPRAPVGRFDEHALRAYPVPYGPPAWERTFYGAGVPDNLRRTWRAWWGVAAFPPALYAAARRRARDWDAVVAHFGVPCGAVGCRLGLPSLSVWHSADVALAGRLLSLHPGLRGPLGLDRGSHWCVRRSHLDTLRPRHGAVQPMGAELHPQSRAEARRALGLGERPVVLFLGRRVPVKGLALLGRAMQGVDAELVVAGAGPVPCPAGAQPLGTIQEPEKSQWLHAADVVAIPSIRLPTGRTEGAPVVLREAWLAGTPVVVSDVVDGVRHERDGLRVPAGDAQALRSAILRLLDDPALCEALVAGGRAHEVGWASIAERAETELYSDAQRRRRSSTTSTGGRRPTCT